MKMSIAISITIHILVFVFLYNVNTSKVYNNDIALYIDYNIDNSLDIISGDTTTSRMSVKKTKVNTEKIEDKEEIDSGEIFDNNTENSSDIETGEYRNAVASGYIKGVKLPIPIYPALAKKRGLRGTTIVDIFIEETGVVYDVKVVSSSGERILDNAVKETILKRWKLPPASKSLVVRKIFEFDLVD